MEEIIDCESNWDYTVQSSHTYNTSNVPKGYSVGDREESYGLAQIHLPAHPNVSLSEATNPEFAIEFLAKNLALGNEGWWSCYHKMALR